MFSTLKNKKILPYGFVYCIVCGFNGGWSIFIGFCVVRFPGGILDGVKVGILGGGVLNNICEAGKFANEALFPGVIWCGMLLPGNVLLRGGWFPPMGGVARPEKCAK